MRLFATVVVSSMIAAASAQTFTTNQTPVGLEHNLLFYATQYYSVTQTGSASLSLPVLFDGRFEPSYTGIAPTFANPTVILIEGLPDHHTQTGAWVGWSTRYWGATRFKIEGYDTYAGANTWRVISDHSAEDYSGLSFVTAIPYPGSYQKLRFTFYAASGDNGRLGVSELFFIHPEATSPYQNLIGWARNGATMSYSMGNVGIGTTNPTQKLSVSGTVRAKEVIVDSGWSDYVFDKSYKLKALSDTEAFIKAEKHLPGLPSAREVAEHGVSVGEMQAKLLAKIEELTLHQIEQEKRLGAQSAQLAAQSDLLSTQSARIERLESENSTLKNNR
jgi:hypothetical protein